LVALSRAELDSSLIFIAFFALFAALLTLRAVSAPHRLARPVTQEGAELIGTSLGALLATLLVTSELFPVLPVFIACMSIAALARYLRALARSSPACGAACSFWTPICPARWRRLPSPRSA
jgi:hypothetical protein